MNAIPRRDAETIDAGRAETPIFEPDREVKEEFAYAAQQGEPREAQQRIEENNTASPTLSGGDVDAAWGEAAVGEESVGGGNPTPDQDIVEDLGRAMGLTYEDNEPLGGEAKLHRRDENRWELNPASAEEL